MLIDTPCRLVPGLEDHCIMVGDLPEVEANIEQIAALFTQYKDCFPLKGQMSCTMDAEQIGEPASFHLRPDMEFPRARARRYSPEEIKVLLEYQDKMVAAGKMRPSSSPVSSNPLLVLKKDGSFRVVVNFIPVNCMIAPSAWPIPDPMSEINKLQGCDWLSCWDCKDGYLQSPIAEACKYLMAVTFPDGLWEYTVLPMGLIDSMQWYTRHMHAVFSTKDLVGVLAAYVDDMTNGTKNGFEEHFRAVEHILKRMHEVNGSFAGAKSAFFVHRCEFLGRTVGDSQVSIDPKKLTKVEYWPLPTNVTELRRFIGFALFMGESVSGFARIATPLFDLYKFDKKPQAFMEEWQRDPRYKEAFTTLQQALLEAPVRTIVDHAHPIIVAADTSIFATGYVVAHVKYLADDNCITINTKYVPILFGSRKLSQAERNMSATERELLGLVYALQKNRHLLIGKQVHVFMDHRALLYLHNLQHRNQRLTTWSMEVASFQIQIHHRPGKKMLDADPLSRIPSRPTDKPLTWGLQDELEKLDHLQDTYRVALLSITEEPFTSILRYLAGDPLLDLSSADRLKTQRMLTQYFLQGQDLMKRTVGSCAHCFVPPGEHWEVLEQYHGSNLFGHLGVTSMFRFLSMIYFWPNQYKDIQEWISTCDACQRFQKKDSSRYRLHRIPPPPSIFLHVGMDLVGPLPRSKGHCYVLNLIDYLSGWVESIAMVDISGIHITRTVQHSWILRFGAPSTIITDNGTSLSQGHFRKFCDMNGIKLVTASPYHPQTNGMVE